jgi:uncharacterized membrane protein YbhN (UPF0104 family)
MRESKNLHEPLEGEPRGGSAPLYLKILRWILMAVCVVWVVWYFYRNRQDLGLFLSLRPAVVLLLLVLFALHLWLYSLQFYFVLRRCVERPLPFVAFFKTIILGRVLSSIAPQAGAVFRAVYLKRKFGITYTRYLGGFFGFLWLDAAMNILLSAAVFGGFAPGFHVGSFSIWWVLAAMTAAWFTPIGLDALLGRLSFKAHWPGRLHGHLSEMLHVVVHSVSDRTLLIRIICLNALNFANNILIFHLCLSGSKNAVAIPALAVFFILLKITSYLIITPGNLGVREIAYAFLAQQMGLKPGEGMVLSVFYRLFGMIIVTLFGIYFGGRDLLYGDDDIQQT